MEDFKSIHIDPEKNIFRLSQLCGGCYIFMVCSTHVEWLPKYYQMGYRNQ